MAATNSSASEATTWDMLLTSSQRSRKVRGGNYVQLATVGSGGMPACRTVVFRGLVDIDDGAAAIKMITDARSQKVEHVTAVNPAAEMVWWCNRNPDYIAWSHGNLNVDNVFFWRDSEQNLDLGVLDWGGARSDSMGWKLWWWLYCCEYSFLDANIDGLLDCFIDEYHANGGPVLEKEELKWQFILSALSQGVGLLGAVPQIYKMCKKTEWPSIVDRKDPRISANVDGKNTLRVYIGTFINICNMIKYWDIPSKLERWIDDVTAAAGIPKKKIVIE